MGLLTWKGLIKLIFTGIVIVITIFLLYGNGHCHIELREQTKHPELQQKTALGSSWSMLPNRTDLPRIGAFPDGYWRNHSKVQRRITQAEYGLMINLLRVADEVFRKWNITYSITAGTLIGSWYNHDIIPWDDDLDIIVDFRNRRKVKEAFSSLRYVYQVYSKPFYLKLSRKDGRKSRFPWTWPFLDIFFYLADEDAYWEYEFPDRRIPSKVFFPLTLRPVGPLWLPSPGNVPSYLYYSKGIRVYPPQCVTNGWDHINEVGMEPLEIKCSELQKSFPFVVERRPAQSPWMSIEKLMLGDEVLQEVSIPLPGI